MALSQWGRGEMAVLCAYKRSDRHTSSKLPLNSVKTDGIILLPPTYFGARQETPPGKLRCPRDGGGGMCDASYLCVMVFIFCAFGTVYIGASPRRTFTIVFTRRRILLCQVNRPSPRQLRQHRLSKTSHVPLLPIPRGEYHPRARRTRLPELDQETIKIQPLSIRCGLLEGVAFEKGQVAGNIN